MEVGNYHVEVLDDHIMSRNAGILITTTWAEQYGDVLSTIQQLKLIFEDYPTLLEGQMIVKSLSGQLSHLERTYLSAEDEGT